MKIQMHEMITALIFIISVLISIASYISGAFVISLFAGTAAGLVLLIKGADYLVTGGSSIASHYGISQMIIGLTIVAFGTSTPEFVVSVYASIVGSGGISIGNVVGSNIFNILIVLGIPAILCPILVKKKAMGFDSLFMILSSVLLLALPLLAYAISPASSYEIGLFSGLILLAFFIYYVLKTLKDAKKQKDNNHTNTTSAKYKELKKSALLVILGVAGIGIGGQLFVECGRGIAIHFGISEIIIGLTLMSVGTSLPEFAASIISVLKKKHEIAIGNVLGSNIFNILFIAGSAAIASPITGISWKTMFIEIPFMIFVSLLLIIFMKTGNNLSRREGAFLVLLYIAFIAYLFFY